MKHQWVAVWLYLLSINKEDERELKWEKGQVYYYHVMLRDSLHEIIIIMHSSTDNNYISTMNAP